MADFREFQDGELIEGTRYRVVQLVGVGGMGSVYEVEHTELGKRFVLKALLRELARREDLVARMRNEWRALARLQHPNIVNVTDAGTSGSGVPFYVMERLDGETLGARLKRTRHMAVPEAVHVAAGVLEGLSAAHDIGVVHRDVKPPNIFILRDGTVKLLDFGVAKMADVSGVITARGIAVGTPRYMSPEQARGDAVDGRSDIYATGLILFEMLTGAGPFDDARDANELLLAHLARQAPRLSRSGLTIAPELEQIVASMLAKDHRERPPRAATVAASRRAVGAARAGAPASDAPTGLAGYGMQTAGRASPRAPEPETRPESPARMGTLLMRDETTTAQRTITLHTQDLGTLPQKTVIDAPVFGSTSYGDTTQSTTAPFGAGGTLAIAAPAVEARPERTEILTGAVPLAEPGPTHTRVPFVEAPQNLTPPPVVQSQRLAGPVRRELRLALAAAGVALALLVSAGLLVSRGARHTAAAVPPVASLSVSDPSPAPPVTVPSELAAPLTTAPSVPPAPAPAADVPPAAIAPTAAPAIPEPAAAPAVPVAAVAAPVRARPPPAASTPVNGPFLAAARPKKAPPAGSAPGHAQKPADSKLVLPASGL